MLKENICMFPSAGAKASSCDTTVLHCKYSMFCVAQLQEGVCTVLTAVFQVFFKKKWFVSIKIQTAALAALMRVN